MIFGSVTLEDHTIIFLEAGEGKVKYTVTDTFKSKSESRTVDQAAFFKALAIAVHNDGMPDYKVDYAEAEAVQPLDKDLRFIP